MVKLSEMNRIRKDAARILGKIESARMTATRTTLYLDGTPRGRKGGSKVENGAVAVVNLQELYAETLKSLDKTLSELADMISCIEDADRRAVMRLAYLKGYKPEQIAISIGISLRSTFYFLKEGKAELLRLFPGRFVL